MPESCTCGAQLPPDALFCHKCGKPQRELVAPEFHTPEHAEFVVTPATVPLAADDLPMNFRNPVAMRIAFTAAILGALLSWVPVLNVILWLGAGYFAVFFYRRRTGNLLNLGAGLRMGWITGVMMFAIVAVLFAASSLSSMFRAVWRCFNPSSGMPPIPRSRRRSRRSAAVPASLCF